MDDLGKKFLGKRWKRKQPENDIYDVVTVVGVHSSHMSPDPAAPDEVEITLRPENGFGAIISAAPDLFLQHFEAVTDNLAADAVERLERLIQEAENAY